MRRWGRPVAGAAPRSARWRYGSPATEATSPPHASDCRSGIHGSGCDGTVVTFGNTALVKTFRDQLLPMTEFCGPDHLTTGGRWVRCSCGLHHHCLRLSSRDARPCGSLTMAMPVVFDPGSSLSRSGWTGSFGESRLVQGILGRTDSGAARRHGPTQARTGHDPDARGPVAELLVHDKGVGHACSSSNFEKSLVSQVTFPSSLFTSGHLPTARDFTLHHPV